MPPERNITTPSINAPTQAGSHPPETPLRATHRQNTTKPGLELDAGKLTKSPNPSVRAASSVV